jgi:hypothetical protein
MQDASEFSPLEEVEGQRMAALLRQRQALKEEFECRVVARCLQTEGCQVLELVQSVDTEIEGKNLLDSPSLLV